jgi:hypothetical protein
MKRMRAIIAIGILVWIALALYEAPLGYEDEAGFHRL